LNELDDARNVSPEVDSSRTYSRRILGYVGQLIPRKGLRTLIRAVATLNSPDIELWIIGDGPQRGELERLAVEFGVQRRVRFWGFRTDRIELMRNFDIFVLPSELEGIPRCLMEGMALGVPVVATDIPGCRDLIEPGLTGELFNVGDHEELSRIVAALLADPDRSRKIAAEGRNHVRAHFSATAMSTRYADLYRRLVLGGVRPI
jgi:glycosyltransferase involved in cell wall biosynthesis